MLRRIYPTRYGQMHLRSCEGKGIPLVLLHMSPRSGAMWELLQEKMGRPTHAPDRLGYGFSDAPPWALSLEQYAQGTVDTLQAAGINGEVDILGMHTGAIEAIEVAHQLGSRARRVIAVGMPLFSTEEQQRQMEKYSEQPLRPALPSANRPTTSPAFIAASWSMCLRQIRVLRFALPAVTPSRKSSSA
jgi:pimeloyl-ACP methyl ester carboxylesterase